MDYKDYNEKRKGLAAQMADKVDPDKYAKFKASFENPFQKTVEKPGIWDALKARVSK